MTRIVVFSTCNVVLAVFLSVEVSATPIVPNGSFENPVLPASEVFQYVPDGATWTFVHAGISTGIWPASSTGFVAAGEIPDGTQYAFIQQQGHYIETEIVIPDDGVYSLSYYAGGRVKNYWDVGGQTSYEIYLDSKLLDSGTTETAAPLTRSDPELFYTYAGNYNLKFLVSAANGDQTALFDQVAITRVTPSLPGDLNADGMVDSQDLDIVRANWGLTVPVGDFTRGDATGDGYVGNADLDLVRANWGAVAAAVPEPGIGLFGLSGLLIALMRRRR